MKIYAEPKVLTFHYDSGYRLSIEVTHGPKALIGRWIHVSLEASQLNAIADWEPEAVDRLDLDLIGPASVQKAPAGGETEPE